jgi:hypothetical protein
MVNVSFTLCVQEYTDMYPGYARTAREEGFEEIAEWYATR